MSFHGKWSCQQKLGTSSIRCGAFAPYYTTFTFNIARPLSIARGLGKSSAFALCDYHAREHTRFYAQTIYSRAYNLGFDDLMIFGSFDELDRYQ